ncbi:hypothetical protein KBD18_00460 [Patescibacteria group bacterium]|nr:hypothetical protein [Patescibacteria group bacterium]
MAPSSRSHRGVFDDEFALPTPGHRGKGHAGRPSAPGSVVRLSLYKKIAATFVTLSLLALFFVLYISFAHATVTIVPKVEQASTTFSLSLTPEPKGADALQGYIFETVVDGTKNVAASGTGATTVEGTACGSVTIVNDQAKAQPLVATTRLLTPDNILFRIKKTITVPANGKTVVDACADKPGKVGDIGPSTFTIPGLATDLQKKTYAQSFSAMQGGLSTVSVVTEAEVAQAVDAYAQELSAQAALKLRDLVPVPEMRAGSFLTQNIVKRENTAKPGSPQNGYTISLSVHVVGVYYDPMALGQTAAAGLRASIGSGRDLISVDQEHLAAKLEQADAVEKKARVSVTIGGKAVRRGAAEVVDIDKIVGLSPKDAMQYLESLPFVASADVSLSPVWARSIPTLKDHVDVVVQQPK